jgi:putative tryptophan/tyrosine transport system substrate-binding protein
MPSFETAARSLKVVPTTAPVHGDVDIETVIIALGREPGSGLVVTPDTFTLVHRAPIISAAARNNVPAVYWRSDFAKDGGLISYGVDRVDILRRAGHYVDLILHGAKPADLLVQFPRVRPSTLSPGALCRPPLQLQIPSHQFEETVRRRQSRHPFG